MFEQRSASGTPQHRERYDNTVTTQDFPAVDSAVGDWHQVWIRCVGDTIEVLRHQEGE